MICSREQQTKSSYSAKHTTSDIDIVRRRWLILDFDPVRPSGISSTDEEHRAALSRVEEVKTYLKDGGWPAAVVIEGGNGGYLLYRIELANDVSRDLINRVLETLAALFDDQKVRIDSPFRATRPIPVCSISFLAKAGLPPPALLRSHTK